MQCLADAQDGFQTHIYRAALNIRIGAVGQPCGLGYYDSYSARYFVEEMQMQGFNMVRCIQGAKTLSLPMQMLGTDLQAHRVNYNNNPILKWCLTNTGIQTDRNGNIVPVKNQSPKQRIDGTAALLDCYVGLYEHYNEFTGAI